MEMIFKTKQETFWAKEFGDEYITRNNGKYILAANLGLFSRIIEYANGISSILEFGSNIGNNLDALRLLLPDSDLSGIEINKNAADILSKKGVKVYNQSILDFEPDCKRDLTFTKGVLIHINPDELQNVYQKLYDASKKYILVAEYYNPTPVSIPYRGHSDKLFKRDFAGEIMEKFPDLKLAGYGFSYHKDNSFPQDDITWFLMEKA